LDRKENITGIAASGISITNRDMKRRAKTK
jgi:hypothetical protein